MFRGSNSDPGKPEPKNSPGNEEVSILITQFRTPQQFSYVRRKDVEASAAQVRQLEKGLVQLCTKENKKLMYLVNQHVIVQYKPVNPPRLLRGVVKKHEDEEYLVWIFDYGFTLCCSSLDMWPLPEHLHHTLWDILDGSIAYISPRNNGNWSKSALRLFDKLMEEAIDLKFEVVCQGQVKQNFGTLMFKTASQSEVFQDADEFLLEGKHAVRQPFIDIMLAMSFSEVFSYELAEINDPMIEARPRVKQIMQLVASGSPSSQSPTHNQLALNKQIPQLPRELKPIYSTQSFDIVKVLGKSETWSGSSDRNLNLSLDKLLELENKFEYRTVTRVPEIARIRRSLVSNSNGSCVTSALGMPSIVNNQSSEDVNAETDSGSEYEDAQPPEFGMPSQSPSPSASTVDLRSSVSGSGSLAPEVPTTACQNVTKRLETAEATYIPSSSSSVPENAMNQPKENLDRIYNDILGKMTNVGLSAPKDNVNRNVLAGTEASNPQNIVSTSSVLAHSWLPVHPVTSLDELPFAKEIGENMSDLNIHSMLPMQMYSWPHLLNGGSLVLVNSCGNGRSWSYLPALCSKVFRSLEISKLSRDLKLGPLAILLVDSIGRANALAGDCAFLMPKSSDTPVLSVVNTHGHSFPSCQMMLLNSCGILVTTSDHLLELLSHEIPMIDAKRLEYFVFDDFDRLRLATPQLLDKVLQKFKALATCPSMQVVVVAQQWHEKEFGKLVKRMAKPLALFGDFLEAAMYGGLVLKFSLKKSAAKSDLLLKFLAKQKAFKKRTLIYCKYKKELDDLHATLIRAGHECIGLANAEIQQPHQLLLLSDEFVQLQIPVRNIELLVHFSLPQSWSQFVKRFHAMADVIPNYFTTAPQNEERKEPLFSYLLLDDNNSRELGRLSEFILAHGVAKEQVPWMKDESIPYCPYLLSTDKCLLPCRKRHEFSPADMPPPGNPLQQPGTVLRCTLLTTYRPGHMAVWPLEYQTKGSTAWVDAPYPVKQWLAELEMSMGTKRIVHNPYRLGDVCVFNHQGHYKRARIVDNLSTGLVTVQIMDYGTELLQVQSYQLLQCPEQKFRTLPPLAMDIRVSGVNAKECTMAEETAQWVQKTFGTISDRLQMQLTVDFAMLNVAYAKEVTLVEEYPSMRTSVDKPRPKELPSQETTTKVETPREDIAQSSSEANNHQPSTSNEAFYKALMQELYTKSPSKKQHTHQFLQGLLEGNDASDACNEDITAKKPTARQELKLEDAFQGPSSKPVAQSLQFCVISKGAVRPRVKWSQTLSHIELTFEQKVPEYKICLDGKTLIYYVSDISPPQHCVLPLLREVRLVSEKQYGYYLKVKLAKVGVLTVWPTLLTSVYAQQNSRWLTYDPERVEEPRPPAGLMMFERFSRHEARPNDDYSSEEDDEFDLEICERGVERPDSATTIYDDY